MTLIATTTMPVGTCYYFVIVRLQDAEAAEWLTRFSIDAQE